MLFRCWSLVQLKRRKPDVVRRREQGRCISRRKGGPDPHRPLPLIYLPALEIFVRKPSHLITVTCPLATISQTTATIVGFPLGESSDYPCRCASLTRAHVPAVPTEYPNAIEVEELSRPQIVIETNVASCCEGTEMTDCLRFLGWVGYPAGMYIPLTNLYLLGIPLG